MGCLQSSGEVVKTPRADMPAGSGEPTKYGGRDADPEKPIVMGKYRMSMAKNDLLGEGSSSICRKGIDLETGQEVAIKVYKTATKSVNSSEEIRLQKFKRQIQVLKMLQEPFQPPKDETLWHGDLAKATPSKLFMMLVDYSKDAKGEPAPDTNDGVMYVITEVAQYSLKDYFALKREKNKPLSRESIKACARAIILVVAGLHAKGLVHLDLKPENLMMFNGRLKLIDVDGCVPIDSEVSINDSSISFSPCYCAPEWARFLIDEAKNKIIAKPHLDVWSIGITLCELVTLDAILKPMYGNFLRNGHSHREAGFLFMDWLGHITRAPVPKSIERFDKDFHKLIVDGLLVCDHMKRKSLAQCLSDPYIFESSSSTTQPELHEGEKVQRQHRHRFEDTSSKAPLYKGTLWKLNTDGNPEDAAHWLKRDMWVACDGSLCYFSIKENKRLVLLDGVKLAGAKVENMTSGARQFAFKLDCINSDDHEQDICMCFSAESEAEYGKWRSLLSQATNLDGAMQTIRLGGAVADELKQFRLAVKNRRMKVGEDTKDQFAPLFKAKLWKVKAEGDRKKQDDWFEREMWIAKNGSLVYWSKKEDRELVYYTADDISNAKFVFLEKDDAYHPFAFQVHLAPSSGVEFAPGEFAAESEAMRDRWISEMTKFKHG